MINLIIDGIQTEVEEGATILEAAESVGVSIPTLCHHKALPAYGACRLCVVEVGQENGRTSVQASCTYPAQNGLIIKTDTKRIKQTRKIMVELMLAKCPDAEVIINLAKEMGVGKPRLEPKNEDCILCGLCVRICKDRMGKGAIGFANRGNKRIVVPAFEMHTDACQTCGACVSVCPTKTGIKLDKITENKPVPIWDEFNEKLVTRSAIYIPYAQAVPNYAHIDAENCVQLQTGECKICTEYCEADAINFDQKDRIIDLNIGSVIVASGSDKFDPTPLHEYGFGKFKNVLTSIQFERVLAASGPYEGHLQRPADGKVPTKIAWIQCVGSRNENSNMPYCSSVCCMYALKEAIIAKEHVNTVEPTIFYMDIRAHGKDFDKFYDQAKDSGVRFIRSRVGKIEEIAETGNLELYYVDDAGKLSIEEFDLVVLSIGLKPADDIVDVTDKLDVRLNEYNFIENAGMSSIQTTRPGIYVCGPAASPKDIPETVMQASGAVAGAAEILAEVRGTEISPKVYPDEIDVTGKKPRIGVFVCHCGTNISSVVDVKSVVEFAKTLPNVVYATDNIFTCSQDTQEQMKDIIKEYKLNRVIVSSCSPSTHEELFQETLREAGLNKFLFDMANIRNHCSWVHKADKPAATEKAKRLTKIAISKGRLLEPLHSIALDVTQTALVIGGGLSGMTTALSIANQGFEVALVERNEQTGGNLNRLDETVEGKKVIDFLTELRDEIEDHELIKLYTDAKITKIDGYVGNFTTELHLNNENEDVKYDHGVIVIATGANESKPTEYLYEEQENVITQLEFEEDFEKNVKEYKKMKNIVLIQCVGSRDENRPYCSRVCCTHSIKNAIRIKELNPKVNIHILYRDIRTYGFNEKYYKQARDLGIMFMRYELDSKPVVDIDGKQLVLKNKGLRVTYKDPIMGMDIVMYPDKILLASAIVPQEDASELSQMLKIPLNEDNFYMEAHVKLRPVDFSVEGLFLAGLAHSPKGMEETISQAKAAAERATMIISSDKYIAEANIAKVDLDACAGCGMCVSVCPYGAPELFWRNGKEFAHINSALCKGCGSCAAVCPSGAMQQLGYKEEQQLAMLTEALEVW